jgi:hypothetical protein
MAESLDRHEVIYAGERRGRDPGTLIHFFLTPARLAEAVEAWEGGKCHWLTLVDCTDHFSSAFKLKERFIPNVIGGVYNLPATLDGTKVQTLSTAAVHQNFLRASAADPALAAAWKATSEVERLMVRKEKMEAKRATDNYLDLTLNSLAEIYAKVPPNAREPFKLMVLSAMTKGKR